MGCKVQVVPYVQNEHANPMQTPPSRPRLRIPIGAARAELAELTNRAHYGEQPIILTKHGRDFCAIVHMADIAALSNSKALGIYEHLRSMRTTEIEKFYRRYLLFLLRMRFNI
jgi:prevent-host-death family protein